MIKKPLLSLLLFSVSYLIFAQQNQISNAAITFEFVAKKVKGQIAGFQSESSIDFQNLENSVLKGSVAVKTLDTNNGLRNWSLKNGKYFDEDDHPRLYFESTSITKMENDYMVKGNLTIKGITKQWSILFKKSSDSLKGEGQLYTSDFDIRIKKKREDNLVKVYFDFELD